VSKRVYAGSAGRFDEHRNTSRVFPVPPGSLERALSALAQASDQNQPWYRWIIDRQQGRHRHDLRNVKGEPVSCPVSGCREHPQDGL
jgi:hypothetical protein